MMGTVEFYENVNRLQEVIEASEDRRLDLNRQFLSALKSDVIKDKRNISQLQAYWKQICDNEARSRDRNAKLLDDIDRIERDMGSLARKTERLRSMKKQYEEYVERMYPNWREQLQTQLSQEPSAERPESHVQAHPVRDSPPVRAMRTPPAVIDSRARSVGSPMHALRSSEDAAEVPPLQLSGLRSTSSNEKSDFPTMLTTSTAGAHGDTGGLPPTAKSDLTAVTPMAGKSPSDAKKEQRVSFDMSSLKKVLDSDEDDEDVEFEIPILSSRESTPKAREVMRVEVQNHPPPSQLSRSNGESPALRASHDLDLAGPYDPPKLTISGLYRLLQFVEEEIKNIFTSPSRRHPMFYRSSTPKDSITEEVVNLANTGRDPGHLNPVSVSMVIGDQLPAMIAALPQHCLLSDVIVMDFVNSLEKLDEEYITSRMPDSKINLWNRLLTHFKALVHYQVMKPQELAELFAASLIYYDSRLEVKAIDLLAAILEDSAVADSVTEDSTSMTTPRASLPTVTFAKREANPLGDSLMATAGSFNDTTPLKVTRNPELRSTESDQQLVFLRNALRAKDASDDEDDDYDNDLGTGHWKKTKKEEEKDEDESNEFDVLDGAKPSPFISASIQSPAVSASLKDSDAYQKMLGRSSNRKSSTYSSDDDDLELMLTGPATRASLPAVRELDLAESGERAAANGRSNQDSAQQKPLTTQELQSIISKDQDDLDIETSGKPWNSSQSKTKDNVVDIDDYDDEFEEFYQ